MAYNLKTATPGSASASALIFGAETQSSADPSVYNTTGSGSVVLSTSPSLTTPTLGVASATSVNKLTITTPATGSTLTILDGKTLTANNTLTLTGTDGSSVAFGAGGTVIYSGGALGTPSSGTLTNATGLPIGGISATGTPSASTFLRGDGSWQSVSASPGGSDTQIQYNNAGSFGGLSQLTYANGMINVVSAPFGLSGNISSTAWTTSGIRFKNASATLTDTSSTGTVATAYTNVFGGNTIAASNVGVTFTNYYTTFISGPNAGSNVTFTAKWALGLSGSLSVAGQIVTPTQTLTDGTNIAWDVDVGAIARVTLGGNRTLSAPTNLRDGGTYVLRVIQDGTGNRTLAYNAVFKWPGGVAPVLSTGANAIDILTFVSDGTNLYGSIQQAFA